MNVITRGGVAAVAPMVLAAAAAACTSLPASTPPPTVVRMVNAQSGPFTQQLAAEYSRRSQTLKVEIVGPTPAPLEAMERGQADMALGPADSAYFWYRRSAESRELAPFRSIATLQLLPSHMVIRAGLPARTTEELKGHTVGVAANSPMADLLIRAMGLTREPLLTSGAARIEEGTLDAALIAGYYPAPPVEAALRRGARLISVAGPAIDRLRQEYPFIRLVTIPAQTYPGQTEPIYTVGVELIYLCRGDLSEAVVYELTKVLFEALPTLAKNFSALRALDVTHAAATVIPLHDGAARYYREIELLP